MKNIEILHENTGEILVENCHIADSFFTRFKGLMGKKHLNRNEGLCILPCKSIHTFFMRFSIDVIFVGNDDVIVKIIQGLKPWRLSPYIKNAKYVIELCHDTKRINKIKVGQKIQRNAEIR